MRNSRPARYPLNRRKVKWDHIHARQKHAIKCARGGDKIWAARGIEHRGNHGIDRLRFDPHVVAASLLIGSRRAPIEQLLVARRQRLLPTVVDHIEIKANAAAFELRGVHGTNARLYAGALEIANESERKALLIARCGQDFE